MKKYVAASMDAQYAVEKDEQNWKAYWRLAVALLAMSHKPFRTRRAIEALENALQCPSLPEDRVPNVEKVLKLAKARSDKQNDETPMPESCPMM